MYKSLLRREALVVGLLSSVVAVEGALFVGCGAHVPPTVKDGLVKVGVDACEEIAREEHADDWVELACRAGGGDLVKVLLPRREWSQIRARGAGSVSASGGDGGSAGSRVDPGK